VSPTKAFLAVIEAHMDECPGEWDVVDNGSEIINDATRVSVYLWGGYIGLKVNGASMGLPFGGERRSRRAVNKLLATQAINKFKEHATNS
jgi:hypothetical protein